MKKGTKKAALQEIRIIKPNSIHQNFKEKYKFKKEKLRHPMLKLPSYHSTYRVRQKSFFSRVENKQEKNFYVPLMMRNRKINIVFSTTTQKSVPRNTFRWVRFVQTKTAQQIIHTKRKYYAKQLLPVVSRKFFFKRTLLRRKKLLTFLPKLLAQKKRRRGRKKRKPKRKKIPSLGRGKRSIVCKKAFRKTLLTAFWGHRLLLAHYTGKVDSLNSLVARINFQRNLP